MNPSSEALAPAPAGDAQRRAADLRLAVGIAAALSLAWASVLLVKLLPAGMAWPQVLALFLAHTGIEFMSVLAMALPVLRGLPRMPRAGGTAATPSMGTAPAALAALWLLATLLGTAVAFVASALAQGGLLAMLPVLPMMLARQGTLALLLLALAELKLRHERASAALHESRLRSLALQRELDAARLAVLSAQIEPHFLFNTLANVRRLLRTEPPAARQLLAQLRRYLEEALPLLRQAHSTLGREAELVQAYLAVHQVRMGPRLAFTVEVPAALHAQPLPPMLLLTLVENAIKHGLAPQVEGGTIRVHAERVAGPPGDAGEPGSGPADELVLTVADTGRGLVAGLGSGTGLANLRSRLRSQHGPAARLALRTNEPQGVVAEVRLPWQHAGATA